MPLYSSTNLQYFVMVPEKTVFHPTSRSFSSCPQQNPILHHIFSAFYLTCAHNTPQHQHQQELPELTLENATCDTRTHTHLNVNDMAERQMQKKASLGD
eukprot:c16608_g1_i1 orf=224-520(+)